MKFRLWKEYGALNSKDVFSAFERSCVANGHNISSSNSIDDADCHVIWSVLFHGRMARNKDIWTRCHELRKPVIVLEVGRLRSDRVTFDGNETKRVEKTTSIRRQEVLGWRRYNCWLLLLEFLARLRIFVK